MIEIESRANTIRRRVSLHAAKLWAEFKTAASANVSAITSPNSKYKANFRYGSHTFNPLEGSYALILSYHLADDHTFVPPATEMLTRITGKKTPLPSDVRLAYLAVKTVETFAKNDEKPWEVYPDSRNLLSLVRTVFDMLRTKPDEGPDGALTLALLSFPDEAVYSSLTGRESN